MRSLDGTELTLNELTNGLIRLRVNQGKKYVLTLEATLTDDELRTIRDEATALLRKRSRRRARNQP